MCEINKILKGLNKNRAGILSEVGCRKLRTENISSLELLYAVRHLLVDAAKETGIEFDEDKVDKEIYGEGE